MTTTHEIRRCTECGKPLSRNAQKDHVLRRRNSLAIVNDTCATCNNRYLEKWDLSGELPPGPHDALLNVARRTILLAQWVGCDDISDAARIVERYELKRSGWTPNKRKRKIAPTSEYQEILTAILDDASRWRKYLEWLTPKVGHIPDFSITIHILLKHARSVEQNPQLFIEWWETSDHDGLFSAINSTLQVFDRCDSSAEMPAETLLSRMLYALENEACIFLTWLHRKTREPELTS
jgi:hypothetical protein